MRTPNTSPALVANLISQIRLISPIDPIDLAVVMRFPDPHPQ